MDATEMNYGASRGLWLVAAGTGCLIGTALGLWTRLMNGLQLVPVSPLVLLVAPLGLGVLVAFICRSSWRVLGLAFVIFVGVTVGDEGLGALFWADDGVGVPMDQAMSGELVTLALCGAFALAATLVYLIARRFWARSGPTSDGRVARVIRFAARFRRGLGAFAFAALLLALWGIASEVRAATRSSFRERFERTGQIQPQIMWPIGAYWGSSFLFVSAGASMDVGVDAETGHRVQVRLAYLPRDVSGYPAMQIEAHIQGNMYWGVEESQFPPHPIICTLDRNQARWVLDHGLPPQLLIDIFEVSQGRAIVGEKISAPVPPTGAVSFDVSSYLAP